MIIEWFNRLIKKWDNEIKWSDSEIEEISERLIEISRSNGGEILCDSEKINELPQELAIAKVNKVIQARMTYYANILERDTYEFYFEHENKNDVKPEFLQPSKLLPKINLNNATLQELESLKGIGSKSAIRILKLRKELGEFTSLDDLGKVKGIGKIQINQFKDYVFIADRHLIVYSDSINQVDEFFNSPNIHNYIKLIKSGICIDQDKKGVAPIRTDFKSQILFEIDAILQNVLTSKYKKRQGIKSRSSQFNSEKNKRKKVEKFIEGNSLSGGYSRIISSGEYPHFVNTLITSAKKRVYIIMFFLQYKDQKNYPTNSLVEKLVDLKKIGVDIKVILDKDRDNDVYGSRIINKEVYDLFKNSKIEVKFDLPEQALHSKIVIVDDEHVVLGSHNWTAGSFFQYDDKSIYLNSMKVNNYYTKSFNNIWKIN